MSEVELVMEFPYDLNNLFNLSYSFEILKQSIEFLAKNQLAQAKIINKIQGGQNIQHCNSDANQVLKDHERLLNELRNELNRVTDRTGTNEKDIEALQKELDKFKQSNDDTLKDILARLKDQEAKTAELDSSLQLMKTLGGVGGGKMDDGTGKGLLDALEILVDNLRKECYAKFADKDDQNEMQKKMEELNDRLSELEQRVETDEALLKDCKDQTDTNRLDIEDILAKLHDLNTKLNGFEGLEDLLNRLLRLEEEMENKLDKIDFANEVARLREMIGNSVVEDKGTKVKVTGPQGHSQSGLTSAEIAQLRQILEKFPQMESSINSILKDLKHLNIQSLREQIESIQTLLANFVSKDDLKNLERLIKEIQANVDMNTSEIARLMDLLSNLKGVGGGSGSGASNNDVMLLRSRMEYVENQIKTMSKLLADLKKQVDDLSANMNKDHGGSSALEKAMKDLESQLRILRADVNKLTDETGNNFKNHQDQINKKADKQDLDDLEARIMDKINEMIKKLLASFADRADTLKRLAALEKNVKSLFELLMARQTGGGRESEEDAMFTKKPLGGISCASCERNITNLQGVMADYQPWKKLPFRETNDRIARVSFIQSNVFFQYGPGFSKILSMMRPEQNYDQSRMEPRRTAGAIDETNNSLIQDHSITVEMPQGVNASSKASARTGYHFYKNSAQINNKNSSVIRGGGTGGYNNNLEESPPRIHDDTLPHLNVRVIYFLNQ
ncbi:UNKNOWN [Stylonychia lemnae]|uniref:Uncharacterized protein n=1 Tax=Stylonychia lemnae TaxID=5949 RepID=A0A078A3Z7_STYLE|nr:UNKNOWN [Stylonychia lemnae]|eukprot:CDW76993.1 UNKNOWN [Stylonychia lemnae]